MKRILSLALLVLLAALGESYATTVTFSASGGRIVRDSGGTQIANGDLVWVGTFANESFSFNSSLSIAANISAIESAGGWNQFTLDTSTSTPDANITNSVTIGGLAGGGKVTGTVTDDNSGATKADFFNGKTIYLWVFNASTTSGASQMGIFRAGSGAAPAWVFPTNAGGLSDNVVLGTDSTTSAPNMVAVGGAGTTTTSSLQLVATVPEPSSLVTLASAAGFVAMLRRRRPSQS